MLIFIVYSDDLDGHTLYSYESNDTIQRIVKEGHIFSVKLITFSIFLEIFKHLTVGRSQEYLNRHIFIFKVVRYSL